MKKRKAKPRLTAAVLEGLSRAVGAIEAGPGESGWNDKDREEIAKASEWLRGMWRHRAAEKAAR